MTKKVILFCILSGLGVLHAAAEVDQGKQDAYDLFRELLIEQPKTVALNDITKMIQGFFPHLTNEQIKPFLNHLRSPVASAETLKKIRPEYLLEALNKETVDIYGLRNFEDRLARKNQEEVDAQEAAAATTTIMQTLHALFPDAVKNASAEHLNNTVARVQNPKGVAKRLQGASPEAQQNILKEASHGLLSSVWLDSLIDDQRRTQEEKRRKIADEQACIRDEKLQRQQDRIAAQNREADVLFRQRQEARKAQSWSNNKFTHPYTIAAISAGISMSALAHCYARERAVYAKEHQEALKNGQPFPAFSLYFFKRLVTTFGLNKAIALASATGAFYFFVKGRNY